MVGLFLAVVAVAAAAVVVVVIEVGRQCAWIEWIERL